jgi:hypothetical protein
VANFARLTKTGTGKSDASGNLTITFPETPPQHRLWRGTCYIDLAPATASTRITSGGEPWGTTVGGAGLYVEQGPGDQLQCVGSGFAASTQYNAWLKGSDVAEEFAASGVGYLSPFPSALH